MLRFFKKKTVSPIQKSIKIDEDYTDIQRVADYFKKETGVTFVKQMSVLKNKVATFCRQREIYSFSALMKIVQDDSVIKQELIDYLTTNETFFYREFKQIEELVRQVKELNTHVDILCAPSSTGEEPYSIAIALLEAGIASYDFHIVGIDINSDATNKAKIARYKERNIRNLSSNIVEKYFKKEDEQYVLQESIKTQVSFKIANIFENSFKELGKFDFIFSRNMLIYFDYETKIKAKNILESMRKDGNRALFFGHADLF